MGKLGVKLGYDDDGQKGKEIVHVLAVPYPAQGHIVPLMHLCRKLASEEGVMVTFVNTMHNHARMLQAEIAAGNGESQNAENNFIHKNTTHIHKPTSTCPIIDHTCSANTPRSNSIPSANHNMNTTSAPNITRTETNSSSNSSYVIVEATCVSTTTTNTVNITSTITNPNSSSDSLWKDCTYPTVTNSITNYPTSTNGHHDLQHNISKLCENNSNTDISTSTNGKLNDICKDNNNIRLVGIPGGLPPELHGDPAHVVAVFQASEALCGPLEELIEKLNQEGPPVTCIVSDVLVSWTQECAEKVGIPRFAFWTSSAAVYHVIWNMYGLISQGIPTFKEANTIFEDNNTKMVSCIPGLPAIDLNDLPVIVRSDPGDFIYQFLTRQLKPMERAAAVLLNTFYELEEQCLQALIPATSPVPIYSIGPLLPPQLMRANVEVKFDGALNGIHDKRNPAPLTQEDMEFMEKYKHSAEIHVPKVAISATIEGKADGKSNGGGNSDGESEVGQASTRKAADKAISAPENAPSGAAKDGGKASYVAEKAGVKALCTAKATRKAGGYSSAGIFNEDVTCLEWLDKKEPCSVLYISFGSIFAMSVEQFTELVEGLQASKQAFLWAIRPGFVQGTSSYTHSLPPSFLESTKDRGMLVSWVPQLMVLAHPAIGGFLTHCGWNSTLESVAHGVPMLCWPDVGERRTNGRLAVSLWHAGLEFSYSLHTNGLLISREEVKRVILRLMDSCSPKASQLRAKAASLQMSVQRALSHSGSSSQAWNLFLDDIQRPHHP